MPGPFNPNSIGEGDDRVRIVLGGDEVLVAESCEVKSSVFTQPAAFSLRLGHGYEVGQFLKKYTPNTPFELYIGPNLQQTGFVDTVGASEAGGGAEFNLRGRDLLAPMHDDLIDSERSFNEETYFKLARRQLDEVGLQKYPLRATNRAYREIKAGVRIVELAPPRTVEEILTNAGPGPVGSDGIVHQVIQAKLGERRYDFLRRYLDMAGLFLWAGANEFILSEPNANQDPIARILRTLNQTREDCNVKSASYENATEHRFSNYQVYGRGAGKKNSHAKVLGEFKDPEMVSFGFAKSKTIRSPSARTPEQATFIARRHCAEASRAGFKLRYTMSGYRVPSLYRGVSCVWTTDTVVEVVDEILGINDRFYVSDVTQRQNPQAETEIGLTRMRDLVFGPLEFPPGAAFKALPGPRTTAQILTNTG
jgi:prophage tail gpP-like protein